MSEQTNLIICCAGDKSLHSAWISSNSSYDLMILYYGTDAKTAEKYKTTAKYFFQQKGYKFELIRSIVAPLYDSGQLNQYKYIWLPDDDLEVSSEQLDQMFIFAEERNCEIWQPSIANHLVPTLFHPTKSWHSWADTKTDKQSNGYRRINFPEIMMPGFSAYAFKHIFLVSLKLFPKANVGWIYQEVWGLLSKHHHPDGFVHNYIFDDITVYHTVPVNIGSMMHKIGSAEYKLYQGNITKDELKSYAITEPII